jgi:hypothetical protein
MRRISAILLVALFGFSPISPAVFASQTDSSLPECCRRAGKHHCTAMEGQSESSPGPSLRAARCPLFPTANAIPVSRTGRLLGISQSLYARLVTHPALRPQTVALCRTSYSRADQKRGPPISLA